MILQLDGATQAATTLNFVGNNALLSGGVLNISRMAYQDKVVLRYSNAASDKDLSQGVSGELLWNGADVITTTNLATYAIPITHESYKVGTANVGFGAFDINTQTLTLQNSAGVQGLLTVDNGGNLKINNSGVTTVAYVDNEFATHEYDKIDFKDSSNVVRSV